MLLVWMFGKLYTPRTWSQAASFLASAMKGNGAPILDASLRKVELNNTAPADTRFAGFPVSCIDGPDYGTEDAETITQNIFASFVENGKNVSPHFAAVNSDYCYHWSRDETRPKDRFTGPFNNTLSNVMLIIGNTADVGCRRVLELF